VLAAAKNGMVTLDDRIEAESWVTGWAITLSATTRREYNYNYPQIPAAWAGRSSGTHTSYNGRDANGKSSPAGSYESVGRSSRLAKRFVRTWLDSSATR
jgi:hypothetical protein